MVHTLCGNDRQRYYQLSHLGACTHASHLAADLLLVSDLQIPSLTIHFILVSVDSLSLTHPLQRLCQEQPRSA